MALKYRRARADKPRMYFGTSIFLIALGAILKYAVTVTVGGIDLQTVGVILIVAGVVGLLISIFLEMNARGRRRDVVVEERPVVRERG